MYNVLQKDTYGNIHVHVQVNEHTCTVILVDSHRHVNLQSHKC